MKLYIVENWMEKADLKELKSKGAMQVVQNVIGNIQIAKCLDGKPYVVNDSKYINWSHNEKYLVIALSESGQIGVDLEVDNLQYDEKLHGWVLNNGEKVEIEKGRCFAEVWTRKEAILKYTGEGLSEKMCEFNSYDLTDLHVMTVFRFGLCISICTEKKETIELFHII